MIDVSKEIKFRTARAGGKGGQNVNKVETMVEGYFHVNDSLQLTPEQKELIAAKLANKITTEGFLLVKSQTHRSQIENKAAVLKKIHQLLREALTKQKKRLPTKPSFLSKQKRLDS